MNVAALFDVLARLVIQVREFGDAPELQGKQRPTRAIVRGINLTTDGNNKINLEYVSGFDVNVPNQADLDTLRTEAAKGDVNLGGKYAASVKKHDQIWPYASPLSLNNKEYVYFIFVLNAKANWQFSRQKAPITIGTKSNAKNAYFEARRIRGNGTLADNDDIEEKCYAASLIADGKAAGEGITHYIDRINLHVDLRYEDSQTKEILYMPLIIDPDIRHPGGSGADEGGGGPIPFVQKKSQAQQAAKARKVVKVRKSAKKKADGGAGRRQSRPGARA